MTTPKTRRPSQSIMPPVTDSDATLPASSPSSSRPTQPAIPPEAATAPSSARVGTFIRTEHLGSGGMGDVWKAWDTKLSRWVALKFLRSHDEDELARFRREATLAGRLTHPNIAAVYDVGSENGQHFIAMQYVEGRTLKDASAEPRTIAQWIRDAARAAAFAHERGVIHRDLKPENVMLQGSQIYVMDFGLARHVSGDKLSLTGTVVGTPAYMPPEQAQGARVTVRADVYSLGATLYDLLTGHAPFKGGNVLDILRSVQDDEPVAPRRLVPSIPAELETIALKCLEKDPARRYETASALADDLQRWLDGEAILAHPPSILYRLRKRFAKKRAVIVVALLGIVGIAIALAVVLPRLRRAQGDVELWARVSVVLTEADLDDRLGHTDRAREKIDRGLELCRQHLKRGETAQARFFLARLLHLRGDRDESLRELDRAVELDAGFADARFERGLRRYNEYLSEHFAFRRSGESVAAFEARRPDLEKMRRQADADLGAPLGTASFTPAADRRLGEALRLWAAGNPAGARDAVRSLIDDEPACYRAYTILARILIVLEDHEEALAVITRGLEVHRANGDLYLARVEAKVHIAEARHEPLAPDSLADVDRAIALDRDSATVRLVRGNLNLVLDRFDEAIADFGRALGFERDMPEALAGRSTARRFRAGALSVARRTDDALIEHDLAIADAKAAVAAVRRADYLLAVALSHLEKADTLHDAGRSGEADVAAALELTETALKLDPTVPDLFYTRGRCQEARGEHGAAIADFFAELSRRPNAAPAMCALGDVYEAMAIDLFAVAWYSRTLTANPRDARSRWRRCHAYIRLSSTGAALSDADVLVKIEPGAEAWRQRGLLRRDAGDAPGAIDDLMAVVKTEPDDAAMWLELAALRWKRAEWSAAIADASQALRANPRLPRALWLRGSAHQSDGDEESALKDYTALVEMDPTWVDGWTNRGVIRERRRDFKGAIDDLTQSIQRLPTADAYAWRGIARTGLREFNDALSDYNDSLRLDPGCIQALVNRAGIREFQGRWLSGTGNREHGNHCFRAALDDFEQVEKLFDRGVQSSVIDLDDLEERMNGIREKMKE